MEWLQNSLQMDSEFSIFYTFALWASECPTALPRRFVVDDLKS